MDTIVNQTSSSSGKNSLEVELTTQVALFSGFCWYCHVTQGNSESSLWRESHLEGGGAWEEQEECPEQRIQKAGEGVAEKSDSVVQGCRKSKSQMAWEGTWD